MSIYADSNKKTTKYTNKGKPMTTLQEEIIATLGVKPIINIEEEIRERINFIKNFVTKNPAIKGYVLGISGGQDSTLTGKLTQLAVTELKNEGYEATFIAMRLPYGIQKDEEDAQLALNFIKPEKTLTFNIKPAVDAIEETYNQLPDEAKLTDYHKGNVKARQRMVAQYAVAGQNQLIVCGTDHYGEAVSGFWTLFGDGGVDILPIAGLTKGQGKELLKALGCPERLYTKAPTADLLDTVIGQPDETELGITYEVIDAYGRGEKVSPEDQEKIEARYLKTEHKRHLPITPFDEWIK